MRWGYEEKKDYHFRRHCDYNRCLRNWFVSAVSKMAAKIHPSLGGLIFFGDFITITEELPNYFLDYRERLSNETRWF